MGGTMEAGAAVMDGQSRSLVTLTNADVVRLMPYGAEYRLIQSAEAVIGEKLEDSRITAIGEVPATLVQGHFPGQPVVPGFLAAEMIAQAILLLAVSQPGEQRREVMLVGANNLRFLTPLLPGVRYRIGAQINSVRPEKSIGIGTGVIYPLDGEDSKPFVSCEIIGKLLPPGTWARLLGNGQ